MEQRISLVTLRVTEMARAQAFYEGLGWQAGANSQRGFVVFQMGGMALALLDTAGWNREVGADAGRALPGPSMLAHNVRSRADVDRLVSFALTQGGRLVRPPAEQVWGGYSGLFADPDGHYWEIAHNPAWPLADDGSLKLG